MDDLPSRGELWHASLDPIQGRKQGRDRPCVVVSVDRLNQGPTDLVIVVPVTTRERGSPFHVPLLPPESAVDKPSFAMCEQIRALSIDRLLQGQRVHRYGRVSAQSMGQIEDRLAMILGLRRR